MPTLDDDPLFLQVLETLDQGQVTEAVALVSRLPPEAARTPALRFAALLCHALTDRWDALGREALTWPGEPLQTVQALRALALAKQEPSEEALRLALEAAWLPTRPLPEAADAAFSKLWALWEGPVSSRLLAAQRPPAAGPLAPGRTRPEEDAPPDPFLTALLALLDPQPNRALSLLSEAVEAGLDLTPLRLALVRLSRRAGDRDGARAILRGIPTEGLEAPWTKRLALEREACARDAELRRASEVQLRRGEDTRILRRERGVFLSLEAGAQRFARLVEAEPVASALVGLVNDHLAAGWILADWTLEKGESDSHERFEDALGRGEYPKAISLGRRLMAQQPQDAALAAKVLAAAAAVRGPQGAIELSQRVLLLTEEASSGLRRHASLLYGAGAVEECLGTLAYLEDVHGTDALSPASYALLAGCHVVPRFRPSIAKDLLSKGLVRFPGHPALLEMSARLQLFEGAPAAALDSLAPLLEAPRPSATVLALGLQALLEGEAGGAEAFARRAREGYPEDPLLAALALEVDARTGPALEAHERAVETATGPLVSLERQLFAQRAACRMSAFEDALRLARQTQTRLGDPDPRCLDVIYESLTALEPGEQREDLAEMAAEARRRATSRTLTVEDRVRAQLSAGFHLDPAVLEPLWSRLPSTPPRDPLPAASPEPTCALLPIASASSCAVLFDVQGLADQSASAPWDWLRDPLRVAEEQEAGRLVLAPLSAKGTSWLRVSTRDPRPAYRFLKGQDVTLKIPSGQVYAGPGEALLGLPGAGDSPLALGMDLGGRLRFLTPGRYQVTVWHAVPGPWPEGETADDPADLVFQLGPPSR